MDSAVISSCHHRPYRRAVVSFVVLAILILSTMIVVDRLRDHNVAAALNTELALDSSSVPVETVPNDTIVSSTPISSSHHSMKPPVKAHGSLKVDEIAMIVTSTVAKNGAFLRSRIIPSSRYSLQMTS